jgi:homoaconitase/3-isopropylmalate dehydratase large subunit
LRPGNPLPAILHLELQEAQLKPGRLIVVGDVHGCCDELDLLLARCGAAEHDNVVLVGDLVNKGPKSAQVRGGRQGRLRQPGADGCPSA